MNKTVKILTIVIGLSLLIGLVSEYKYKQSPQQAINVEKFQDELKAKEKIASKTLENLKKVLIHSSLDSLFQLDFPDDEITYYTFSDNQLLFWSDNRIDIKSYSPSAEFDWMYFQHANAHCIGKSIRVDNYYILALITIKYIYPYQNQTLKNDFAKGFNINGLVEVENRSKHDKNSVFLNNYLFNLHEPITKLYSNFWGYLGLIFQLIALLLSLYLYANFVRLSNRKYINIKTFLIAFVLGALILGLGLYYNLPSLIYWDKLFSPFQYASNPFLATIIHLAIVTLYFLSSSYILYFYVKFRPDIELYKAFLLQLIFALHFIFVYIIISGVISHSSIQLSILRFDDISVLSIFTHFLIFLWGISLTMLFYKTHNWHKKNQQLNRAILFDLLILISITTVYVFVSKEDVYRISISFACMLLVYYLPYFSKKQRTGTSFFPVWVFAFVVFFIVNSLFINRQKTSDKYRLLAENIIINGNIENDKMADILLEDIETQIENDKNILRLVNQSDTILLINNYLNTTYLRGFWNKYEMRLNLAYPNSELQIQYDDFYKINGTRLNNTHFYSVHSSYSDMAYLGIFPFKNVNGESVIMYMEFYLRKNYRSYSFPNLLISSLPDIKSQLGIVIAKYEGQKLIYSSEKHAFPQTHNWTKARSNDFYKKYYNNKSYYVYSTDKKNFIVITETRPYELSAYLIYFSYIFAICLLLSWLIIWLHNRTGIRNSYSIGLTNKFQYSFILLMIISFIGIFYVSVNFIQKKYRDEQLLKITNKKSYIQSALQELYYWNQDLTNLNQQQLNFDLQELSYRYHTDIHVYDNMGQLIGSSQPMIFDKSLISKQISPKPFFKKYPDLNQEEHIGKLKYQTGYTDFLNGDFLQIGYIAVPQFFSQEEIRSEIQSFLAVVIHIYLIIIIIAIVFILIIGRQLSAPLKMIESKLKQMKFGHRNEKIEYHINDEIGKLVAQYNRTVDELEKSAKLLAQSERETAWKTMARQIAHEINNPLTPMKLTLQQLQRTKKLDAENFDAYFEKSSSILIEQIDNLSRIASTFSNFARMPEAQFEQVDIAKKLFSIVKLFENNHESIQINFSGQMEGIYIFADPEQLIQVFNNLLKNAIQSIPYDKKGIIDVQIVENQQKVEINFTDNGCGITTEISDKIFIPNFTTKSNGMGLGLSITKNIVEVTGGTIGFTTQKDIGTTFHLTFPLEK